MPEAVSDIAPGAIAKTYRTAMCQGVAVDLHCDLYLPQARGAPLFVWFHGGGFVTGHFRQKRCRQLGAVLSRQGIAVASVAYRMKAEMADLSDRVQTRYEAVQAERRNHIRPKFSDFRALAAMEDGLAFLDWAQENAARFGWSDTRVLAGGSAGAITAFNMAFTAEAAGYAPPRPEGIFSASGGYGYAGLVDPAKVGSVLALHNPQDNRVPVRSVRRMREVLGDQMVLIESDAMIHGHVSPDPSERKWQTNDRIVQFVKGLCG